MLEQLVIRNFAIIDDVTVSFGSGLNVLTGETGAGKSILIDALGTVLGGRASPGSVRTGEQRATIDAEFSLDSDRASSIQAVLSDQGIDLVDHQLLLTREIQITGRSSSRINGRPVTAALLSMIGEALVDIHGQSEHLSLLRKATQRQILDAYGVDPEHIGRMGDLVRQWRAVRSSLDDVSRNARAVAQRIDLLSFQIDEIDGLAIVPGEEEALGQEFSRLSQVERLSADISAASQCLEPEERDNPIAASGALAGLRIADKSVSGAASVDQSLAGVSTRLREAMFLLDDVHLELRRYLEALESNPGRLTEVSDRIARLNDVKRKYGSSIADVLDYREAIGREFEALTSAEVDEEALQLQESSLRGEIEEVGRTLSEARVNAATRLTSSALDAMRDLQLGDGSFFVDVRRRSAPTGETGVSDSTRETFDESGFDDVEFLFAPNAGEIPRPLSRIASGGEMARVMLALKTVLAAADTLPTYVFDEVDVGVGGRSGTLVGEKLRNLAETHQVLVITHLPQVAAFADQHFRIRKEVRSGRTYSLVELLDDAGRVEELAVMLDGEPITAASQASAHEMLERSAAAPRV